MSPTSDSPERRPKTKRIAVACLSCRQRRIRCDGGRPCRICEENETECEYIHTRRRVFISQSEYLELTSARDDLKKRCADLEKEVQRLQPHTSPAHRPDPSSHLSLPASEVPSVTPFDSALDHDIPGIDPDAASGRFIVDKLGLFRYVGDSTSIAFYSSLLDTLSDIDSSPTRIYPSSSYPSCDSHPLPAAPDSPFLLPPKPLTSYLTTVFSQHCTDFLYFVNQYTMQYHISEIYALAEDRGVKPTNLKDRWILTRLYTMLALATLLVERQPIRLQSTTDQSLPAPDVPGMEYFAIASALLPGVADFLSVDAVQTLALIAYYLLSSSYRDAAYAFIGLAMRAGLTLGLHRMNLGRNVVEAHRCRIYWTVYSLDRLISGLMGRAAHVVGDDAVLIPSTPQSDPGLVSFSRIANLHYCIVRDLHKTSPMDRRKRLYSFSVAYKLLDHARTLQATLRTEQPSFVHPRSQVLLQLLCEQAIIVTCRPALLHELHLRFGPLSHCLEGSTATASWTVRRRGAALCQAAMAAACQSAIQLGELRASGQLIAWSPFDTEMIYSSCMVLIVSRLCGIDNVDEIQTTVMALIDMLEEFGHAGNEYARSCGEICKACDDTRLNTEVIPGGELSLVLPQSLSPHTTPFDAYPHAGIAVTQDIAFDGATAEGEETSYQAGTEVEDITNACRSAGSWNGLGKEDLSSSWDWSTFCQSLGIVL